VDQNNIVYQFTVDDWAIVPGHVELQASGGYETMEGCSWAFPTPIFSYDVAPRADFDSGITGAPRFDGGAADAPSALDCPSFDASVALDAPATEVTETDASAIAVATAEAAFK
jgi:hypothetical protein